MYMHMVMPMKQYVTYIHTTSTTHYWWDFQAMYIPHLHWCEKVLVQGGFTSTDSHGLTLDYLFLPGTHSQTHMYIPACTYACKPTHHLYTTHTITHTMDKADISKILHACSHSLCHGNQSHWSQQVIVLLHKLNMTNTINHKTLTLR